MLVSDENADWFSTQAQSESDFPTFKEVGAGQPAWDEMAEGASKHDTLVYDREGKRVFFWDLSENSFGEWSNDIRAVVEAQGLP